MKNIIKLKMKIEASLSNRDALIVVPPFAGIDRPSIAAHILQATCKLKNIEVDVLYANIILASIIGEELYTSICYAPTTGLIGERFFSHVAYGKRAIDKSQDFSRSSHIRTSKDTKLTGHLEGYIKASDLVEKFVSILVNCVLTFNYKSVGCSTSFEQTNSSIAILSRIKELSPNTVTLLGGANCEGEMAKGVLSLSKNIDYVFSGESEETYPTFLDRLNNGYLPETRIIKGNKVKLDELPLPSYKQYYGQLTQFLPESLLLKQKEIWLPFETSRGCWWGEKNQCTFCGINGDLIGFRKKTSEKALKELSHLLKEHNFSNICMIDNIMPYSYFKDFLPSLAKLGLNLNIFYEQKSNLKFWQVERLKLASVNVIQPGIESLSTSLLKHMNKGVSADRNISLLRSARMLGVSINWNILHSFPGDEIEWYKNTLEILPFIEHLHPPTGVYAISIDRFSPYYENKESFALTNIRPMGAYFDVFPEYAHIADIAYHFEADYVSQSKETIDVIKKIEATVIKWRKAWKRKTKPILTVSPISDSNYVLFDSRACATKAFQFIKCDQANAILNANTKMNKKLEQWAINNGYAIIIDGVYIPLATTNRETYSRFAPFEFLN